jgi:hypothetical protein
MASIARASCGDAEGAEAALARLVRSTPFARPVMTVTSPDQVPAPSVGTSFSELTVSSAPRPKRPVPVASLRVAPRSHAPMLVGGATNLAARVRAVVVRGGTWSRRVAIAAGLLTAATTIALLELLANTPKT